MILFSGKIAPTNCHLHREPCLQGSPAAESWLVMFSAPWSSQSLQAAATFADLSLEFGSERLRFGELDVGRWPKMAIKYGMAIDTEPNQLPAFLLFKQVQTQFFSFPTLSPCLLDMAQESDPLHPTSLRPCCSSSR